MKASGKIGSNGVSDNVGKRFETDIYIYIYMSKYHDNINTFRLRKLGESNVNGDSPLRHTAPK
jgi:hypothetical protein